MKKKIKISDYPNIKKQIGCISVILSKYFIGIIVLGLVICSIDCTKEIEKWNLIGAALDFSLLDPAWNPDFSRESRNNLTFFIILIVIGIVLYIYQAYRYNNIRTTKLGKSIWESLEVKDDYYFEKELKRLDYELGQSGLQKIKFGEIVLTEKYLLGMESLFSIDAIPIWQILFITMRFRINITGNANRALLVYMVNENGILIKGVFVHNKDYGNEIVRKIYKRIDNENENFSDKYE